jgi:hypothetical protein
MTTTPWTAGVCYVLCCRLFVPGSRDGLYEINFIVAAHRVREAHARTHIEGKMRTIGPTS